MNNYASIKDGHKYVGALHDINNCEICKRPTITKARYAKNMYSVTSNYNIGWKTREMVIASEITPRYSNREQCYIMSKNQVRKFIEKIKPMKPDFYGLDETEFTK
jgi:hypothetical protein